MAIADNQQETSSSLIRNFYYTGFCAGEMSCSIIKATDRGKASYYYTPDLTFSNGDRALLQEVNVVVTQRKGVITPIKGGYNLSIRGRDKVRIALSFFAHYPLIAGDVTNSKLEILREAHAYLSQKVDRKRRSPAENAVIEGYRTTLREIKTKGLSVREFERPIVSDEAIGYFLAGIIDAEGSIGLKRRGNTYQPFFALAMKDRKIVELLQEFLGYGHVRYRSDGVYHYETASFGTVLETAELFTEIYPSKQARMSMRMERLKRILNDHTRGTKVMSIHYDGMLW